MDSTETEIETQTNQQPTVIKIDRRTIKTAPWRTTVNEDGSVIYNHKPLDPLYFQKYYDAKRKFCDSARYTCECCSKEIAYGHKARHLKTKQCVKAQNARMTMLLS